MELKRLITPKVKPKTTLQEAIEALEKKIRDADPTEEAYHTMIDDLVKLKGTKDDKESKSQVDINTVLVIAGGLLQVGLILMFEQNHVLTSKAMGFIFKGRV